MEVDDAGQGAMTASPQPADPGPASKVQPWYAYESTCNRSYLTAALRAAAIALVLLAVLILVVVL